MESAVRVISSEKVCTIKKPVNPRRLLAYPPAVPELSVLCVIQGPDSKGGKNVSSDNPSLQPPISFLSMGFSGIGTGPG